MMNTKTFAVSGMGCDHCRVRVEQALTSLPGVAEANADVGRKCVRITYDDSRIGIVGLAEAVGTAGYTLGEAL